MFGPLNVVVGETFFGPSDLGGKKPKELLEILMLARGRAVSKDALAECLWPEKKPKSVSGALETYVSVLRRTLFSDRSRGRELLVTGTGSYEFATGKASLDLDEFDRLVARANEHRADRLHLLRQAAEVAVGDVLEDSPSASWAQADRDAYRDRVTRVNLLVADGMVVDGDYTTAIQHAERALQFRPYSEQATRLLMLANHGLSQTELARQAFDRCRGLLADELDLDCSTETVELAGAISAGASIQELLSERQCHPTMEPQLPWRAHERRDPDRRMPFIGRSLELERVRRVAKRSRSGSFEVVSVHGRPCVGRTSFLAELRATLPGSVGMFTYSPLHSETPKLPLAEAILDALSGRPEVEKAEAYAAAAMLGSEEQALAMIANLLRIDVPMVLLLDDFQWADNDTISMVNLLSQALPTLPVTIVAAMRLNMIDGADQVDVCAADEIIRLSSFQVGEWKGLDGIDTSLAHCAGGSPALMADCYRWHQAGNSGPSPSVRESIIGMARGLGGKYSQLLQSASGESAPFAVSDLQLTEGVCAMAGDCDLERLCEMEILERAEGKYRFRSSVVRRVIANTVSG